MTDTPKQNDPAVEELERKLSADGELATSPCGTTFRPYEVQVICLFLPATKSAIQRTAPIWATRNSANISKRNSGSI